MKHFSLPLPLRFPHPLDRVSATKIDRFATLGWWANRSLFLLKLHRGHTLNCQSVARQVGFLEDAAGLFTLNQYRQDRGPGDQRGLRPLRRGGKTSSKSRSRRSLAYLSQHLCCFFPLREKVGRVPSMALPCSRGAPASGKQEPAASAKNERDARRGTLSRVPLLILKNYSASDPIGSHGSSMVGSEA